MAGYSTRGSCSLISLHSTYRGCAVVRRYGFTVLYPGKILSASSLETEPAMITSSPCFQFAGVATLCFAVSCIESSTLRISSKFATSRHRIGQHQLDLLVRAKDEDRAHGLIGRGRASLGRARLFGRQHVVEFS